MYPLEYLRRGYSESEATLSTLHRSVRSNLRKTWSYGEHLHQWREGRSGGGLPLLLQHHFLDESDEEGVESRTYERRTYRLFIADTP